MNGSLPPQASVSPQLRGREENCEAAGSAQDWDSLRSRLGDE